MYTIKIQRNLEIWNLTGKHYKVNEFLKQLNHQTAYIPAMPSPHKLGQLENPFNDLHSHTHRLLSKFFTMNFTFPFPFPFFLHVCFSFLFRSNFIFATQNILEWKKIFVVTLQLETLSSSLLNPYWMFYFF